MDNTTGANRLDLLWQEVMLLLRSGKYSFVEIPIGGRRLPTYEDALKFHEMATPDLRLYFFAPVEPGENWQNVRPDSLHVFVTGRRDGPRIRLEG